MALLDTVGGWAAHLSGPPLGVAVCLLVAVVALLWRTRYPLTVMCVVFGALLASSLLWGSSEFRSGVFCVVVAVYAGGRHIPFPRSLIALVAGVPLTLLYIAYDPLDSLAASWTWSLNLVWVFGLGVWIRQRVDMLDQARAESTARSAVSAAEDRVRIARDLHDILAHNLAVMIVQAEAADELLESDPKRAHRALSNVQTTGRSALGDIRGLLVTLRNQRGLAEDNPVAGPGLAAVSSLVEVMRSAGLPVSLRVSGDFTAVSPTASEAAYRMIQEALTNALRHAGAVPTDVSVAMADHELRVRVHNGGAATSQPRHQELQNLAGHGLRGMRERVETAGGKLATGPNPEGGFTVFAQIPVAVGAL
ncbi:MAG: sensor histidine kinase [Actinomycetes bacterium]